MLNSHHQTWRAENVVKQYPFAGVSNPLYPTSSSGRSGHEGDQPVQEGSPIRAVMWKFLNIAKRTYRYVKHSELRPEVALAFLSTAPRDVFMILGLNTCLHLLLDGLQTKWANGVHLFAPISWDLWNAGLFWPESLPTYIMTGGGLLYIGWQWRNGVKQPLPISRWSPSKVTISGLLLALYFIVPLALLEGPRKADNHFIRTLEETENRPGNPLELDRQYYEKNPAGDMIRIFTGEAINTTPEILDHSALVSVRGRFVTSTTLEILEFHEHSYWFRDVSTYLGLLLLVSMWLTAFLQQVMLPYSPKSRNNSI